MHKCDVCKKAFNDEEMQVVRDLTTVALRPAYEFAPAYHAIDLTLEDMVQEILDDAPLCAKCWHRINAEHDLGQGAMQTVLAAIARNTVPKEAQFTWEKVR